MRPGSNKDHPPKGGGAMPMSTHQSPAKPRSCLLYALLDPGYSWGEVRFSRLPRFCGQFGLLWCEVPQSARKGTQRLDARNGDSSGPGHGFVSHHFGGEVRSRGCWPSWASSCPLALVDVRLQGAQRAVAIARKPAWLRALSRSILAVPGVKSVRVAAGRAGPAPARWPCWTCACRGLLVFSAISDGTKS